MRARLHAERARLRTTYEAVLISSIPARERWKIYALFPRMSLRRLQNWFYLKCPLPGDRLVRWDQDLHARVIGVDRGQLRLEIRSGLVVAIAKGLDWDAPLPPGYVREYEDVPIATFTESGWQHVGRSAHGGA